MKILSAATLAVFSVTGAAQAQTQITCLTNAGHLTRQHEPLVKMFNEMQDEIVVTYAAPAQDYSDTHLKLLRASATGTLPDCAFEAYNQLPSLARALANREQVVDLGTMIAAEENGWVAANYSDQMLDLGRVDGVQYGMPFNASVIQWYVNADLLRQVGASVEDFPTDWDGVIALAARIDALGDDIEGISFGIDQWGDDWPFQVLIAQQGGEMLNAAGDTVTFDENGRSLNAMTLARRLVEEAGYNPEIDLQTQTTAFAEGKMGIYANSPASAKLIQERVGGAFDLHSVRFTVWDDANGSLPTGGNAAIITAEDPAKQQAAWEYIKFLTGPKGQELTARNTGYLPTNRGALAEEYLGAYYAEQPYFATPSSQYERAGAWYGYPGTQSEKIWREQRTIIRSVMLGEITPEDGAEQAKAVAEDLMKR
ncbi:multiple sugar transport system substrate-binding protein [Lutimaribacter pacificus]|uniref:Carbohydrate ABC transporter substrate-binding protein, CUT1 family n=1 Tax=Lutimaribacter pacificus TaxID=391948 RepID=A0A1H0L3W9_9RHOB|nr:ABC transporter substrate-binding protein [Lutimaribacter pacificus]SDO62918.1 multiple sugar transport system substrate-binding protein [Lutimaribacter pacificus]SHK71099.1 carbohydrate ABC transporter substrate-binding protein, CUT1 family [Lutimaribacter pacificus]